MPLMICTKASVLVLDFHDAQKLSRSENLLSAAYPGVQTASKRISNDHSILCGKGEGIAARKLLLR